MENYIEHLVKGKRGTKEYMERGGAIALPFLFMFSLSLLSLPIIFFVFLLPISYYIRIRSDKEYEYLYMAGDLSIDVVYHKTSRKNLIQCSKEEVLEIRPFREDLKEQYQRSGSLVSDFAGLGENPHYFYLIQKEGKKYVYILDCPEKLVKEMRLYSREKWIS